MYPRLFLAKNLLRDDGVIFVSIDDNEVHNLRLLMNEIFGEENFIAEVVWKRKRGRDNSAKWFSKAHEYLLIFTKNKETFDVNFLELDETTKEAYTNTDNDTRGDYRMLAVWARGTQGGCEYAFTNKNGKEFPTRMWLMSKEKLESLDEENKLIFHGNNIYRKLFLTENQGKIPETIWDNVSNAANAADEIKKFFEKIVFDTPKPTPYIKEMLKISTNEDDIVLDFFAGSGTTAQAVMELNKEDSGKRKFICVQLPEKTEEASEAFKAGYKTISEISKERVRRAIKKIEGEIKEDKTMFNDGNKLDLGFKVYKLKESNFKIWRSDMLSNAGDLQTTINMFEDPLKDGAKEENVLCELLLKWGYDLNVKVETLEIDGAKIYSVNNNELILCLEKISDKILSKITALKPARCMMLDGLFEGKDSLKTNTALQLQDAGIDVRVV